MQQNDKKPNVTESEALEFHASGRPGKIQITPTKPLITAYDLSLAYSPGVAWPCLKIRDNPEASYDYTARGNTVAVISNGTAVLGLGNLGALASAPVMEGKAVLFKRFADVDAINLQVSTEDVDDFVNCVSLLGASFGGINLEDIKAPECFIIEQRLREMLDIPVFHDDQHGTAIIAAAGLLNALDVTGRDIKNVRIAMNGAGAAAIACSELFQSMGLPHGSLIMCDTKGVIWQGRQQHMNQWKSAHAIDTPLRTLEEAVRGADIFIGLSQKGCVSADMVRSMAKNPIIFAMANPDPEITPEEVREVRTDAIVATGRSDYPNQINNVLGFPYIFRGALDVRASTINDAMKIAAAKAVAELAHTDVPDEVDAAYGGRRLRYGPEYLIPVPFDPRLISAVPPAVALAAQKSGVARKPLADISKYVKQLSIRLDPTAGSLERIFEHVMANPRRVVFAEGEEERSIRAAVQFSAAGYGTPILVGDEQSIKETIKGLSIANAEDIQIINPTSIAPDVMERYIAHIYNRLHRRGYIMRDCRRMLEHNRNVFSACVVASGDADAIVTGLTRSFVVAYDDVLKAIDVNKNSTIMGVSVAVTPNRTLFLADTAVSVSPDASRLADIAERTATWARMLGNEPRVAMLSFASFGQPQRDNTVDMRAAVAELDRRGVSFEYDGEISVDVALDYDLMKRLYPFCRLSGPANVLVMPNLQAAHIAAKLLDNIGGVNMIGPVLDGFAKPVQIVRMGSSVSDLVTAAVLGAFQSNKA